MKKFIILLTVFCISSLALIAILLGYAISGHQMVTDFNTWIQFSGLLGIYGLVLVAVMVSLGLLLKDLSDEKALLKASK